MTYEHQMMIMYATKLTVACSMMESIDASDMPDDVKEQARETYRMLNNLRRRVWGLVDVMTEKEADRPTPNPTSGQVPTVKVVDGYIMQEGKVESRVKTDSRVIHILYQMYGKLYDLGAGSSKEIEEALESLC